MAERNVHDTCTPITYCWDDGMLRGHCTPSGKGSLGGPKYMPFVADLRILQHLVSMALKVMVMLGQNALHAQLFDKLFLFFVKFNNYCRVFGCPMLGMQMIPMLH